MRALAIPCLLATCLIAEGQIASAQDLSTSIAGTWKLTSFVRKELQTGKVANFYGERPIGYIVFSKTGHMVTLVVGSDRKAPLGGVATDADRAELFKTMYAYSGKYTVQADKVTYELDASWNQSWTGTKRPVFAEVDGDKLTITSPPYQSPTDGQNIVVVINWERIDG